MTIEELEIVITANVTEALKQIRSLRPEIEKTANDISQKMESVKTEGFTNKIGKAVKQASNQVKQAFNNKDTAVEIKANTKEASDEISQLEKMIDSLQKKISASDLKYKINDNAINKMKANGASDEEIDSSPMAKENTKIGMNIESYRQQLEGAEQELANLRAMENEAPNTARLSFFEQLKNKIQEVKANWQDENWSDPFDEGATQNALNLIEVKIDEIEAKIKAFDDGKIELDDKQLYTLETQLDALYAKKEKLEQGSKGSSMFANLGNSMKNIGASMQNFGKQASNVFNNIKKGSNQLGTSFKGGLKHILKYAGALFGIRAIYNGLRQISQAWLTSQNEGAQQVSANIEYMKYALGSLLAPVITFITNLAINLLRIIQQIAYAFSGINIFAKASAKSMKSTAGSAGQAVKETKQLAGIHDEINNIADNNSGGGGGGGGGISPSFDLSEMSNTPSLIADAIASGDWYSVGKIIADKLNWALENIPWEKIQNTAKKIGKNIALTINGFVENTNWKLVGSTIAQGLNTAIYFVQSFITNLNFGAIGEAIGNTFNGFFTDVDWGALANTLSEGLKGVYEMCIGFFKTFDWSTLLDGLWEFVSNIDWGGIVSSWAEALGSAIASLLNLGMLIGEAIGKAIDEAKQYFEGKIQECGGNVVEGIFKGIVDALKNVGQWINDHIFKPFIEGFKNVFKIHSPSEVMEEQGNFIMEGLLNGINALVGKVKEIWETLKNNVIEVFTKIGEKISSIWNTIKEKTTSVWNSVKEWLGITWNNIKQSVADKFTAIKDKLAEIWENVTTKVQNVWNTIKNKIKEGAQGAWNGITSIFGNVADWFRDKFSTAWQRVKDVFSKGGEIFNGIKEGILDGLKNIVNGIISGINRVIAVPFNGLNSALRKIRNVNIAGISPFSWISEISIPQIPQLAKGNVAYEGTLALFGEYAGAKNNPEITAPQSILKETYEDVLNSEGRAINIPIRFDIGGDTLIDTIIDGINDKSRRLGRDVIVKVGD